MSKIHTANNFANRIISVLVIALIVLSGCGLGLTDEDRLNRGNEALANGEYRAAIIDAKAVLLNDSENLGARLLLGRTSIAIGDGVSAEKDLRRAVELGAPFDEIALDLGKALLVLERFDEVLSEITVESASTDADRISIYQLRGAAFLGLRQEPAARDMFSNALQLDENNIRAQVGIVSSYVQEQNIAQARATLDHIKTSHADEIEPHLMSGRLNLMIGRQEAAEADFIRASELAVEQSEINSHVIALSGLSEALLAQSKYQGAREVLANMQQLAPDAIGTKLLTARIAYLDKDWKTAQASLQEILSISPNSIAAQSMQGAVHLQSGNLGQAEMYLSAVVASSPGDLNARRMLAETRLRQNRLAEAQIVLGPIVSGPDADVIALSIAGRASVQAGDIDEGIEFLERARAADPENDDILFQLAAAYLGSGRTAQTQRLLEQISTDSSDLSEYRRDYLLVITELRQGNSDKAVLLAMDLVERWPSETSTHNLLGSLELSSGNFEAARSSFEAASRINPDDLTTIRNLARVDEAVGNYSASRARYSKVLEKTPGATWVMLALARIAVRTENPDEMRDWLEKARQADPSWVVPRRILVKYYLSQRDFEQAELVAGEILTLQNDDHESHYLLGLALMGQADYSAASKSYETALRMDPENTSYRLDLALSYSRLGDSQKALTVIRQDEKTSMSSLRAAVFAASLMVDAGEPDEARKMLVSIRKEYPDSSIPYALEGELYAKSGDLIKASNAYDRALAIEITKFHSIRAFQLRSEAGLANKEAPLHEYIKQRPMDNDVRMLLAQTYQLEGRTPNAIEEYERALSVDQDNPVVLNNLAWLYFERGDQRAEETARRAYELDPDNSSIADTLGWIVVHSGSVKDGVDILRLAVQNDEGKSEVHYHLAAALVKNGETEEARQILQQIVNSDSAFTSRQEAEQLLSTL